MNFLIFSDSHGKVNRIREILSRQTGKIDGIFFCGDGLIDMDRLETDIPIYAVRGNCDAGRLEPAEMVLDFEGHRILLCHGHLLGAKYGDGGLIRRATEVEADIVLFGHTHRLTDTRVKKEENPNLKKDLHLLNPGSIGYGGTFGTLVLTKESVLFGQGDL